LAVDRLTEAVTEHDEVNPGRRFDAPKRTADVNADEGG
jgi:hypothetical protein